MNHGKIGDLICDMFVIKLFLPVEPSSWNSNLLPPTPPLLGAQHTAGQIPYYIPLHLCHRKFRLRLRFRILYIFVKNLISTSMVNSKACTYMRIWPYLPHNTLYITSVWNVQHPNAGWNIQHPTILKNKNVL